MSNKLQVSVSVDSRLDRIEKLVIGVVNGQSAMKSEVLSEMHKLDNKLTGRVDSLEKEMKNGFKEVNSRIDKIGMQVAELGDDTPTIEEFDKLKERVTKVEQKMAVSV